MPTRALTRIVPHLWYVKEAEQAARFYTKIFPKSRIDRVWKLASESKAPALSLRRIPVVWSTVFRDERWRARSIQ